MEVWLPVVGYEDRYSVSSKGRIFSKVTGKYLKPAPKDTRYLTVSLRDGTKSKTRPVHRLVAEAHLPNPNNLPCVNHKDEVKTNNDVSNLEWCTFQYNLEYSNAKSFKFVSPDGDVVTIFNLKAFCRDNNLNASNMHMVLSGKYKQHKGWTLHKGE